MRLYCCIATIASLSLVFPAHADEAVTLESVPPVVISSVPVAGISDVSVETTEIRITFSKPMKDRTWSWSTLTKESFPEITGEPRYLEDGMTCVLPVKLEPKMTYAIWANSGKFRNFKDAGGVPAVPYLLVFRTSEATP